MRIAACNASGKVILGSWFEGTARILDAREAPRADAALDAKYGWQRRGFQFFAKLFGRIKDPVFIEVSVGSGG